MNFTMTSKAESNDIGWIEYPGFVVLNKDNMMHIQEIKFFEWISHHAAILAGVVVPVDNSKTKSSVSFITAFASRLYAKLFSKINKVKIIGKPVRVLRWIIIPVLFSSLAAHSFNTWMIAFFKALIPSWFRLFAVRMMPSFVFRCAQSFSLPLVVDRKGSELSIAPAFTSDDNTSFLSFGNTHRNNFKVTRECSSLPEACKIEKRENCWNPLKLNHHSESGNAKRNGLKSVEILQWAISRRAPWEQVEASTTRLRSPERTVKTHEYARREPRYSLVLQETARSIGLNADTLTKRPYTSKLDDLSLHPVSVVIDKVLKNDAYKTLDRAAHAQFDSTLLLASATSTTITIDTDGTATNVNNQAFDAGVVKELVDIMKERNIPMYDGDDYYCVAHPSTIRPLKNDLETIHQHTETGFGLIMRGEEGRYENTRFIHQNLIAKETTGWSTNSLSNWAFIFGEDNVTEGVCIPEEMRGKIPDDYGRSKGIAWLRSLFTFKYSHEQLAIAV